MDSSSSIAKCTSASRMTLVQRAFDLIQLNGKGLRAVHLEDRKLCAPLLRQAFDDVGAEFPILVASFPGFFVIR
jgi:hypothetical protein